MPPCSDVRALARALGEGDDDVTFIDVMPLQRLALALAHMPAATLEALVQLHDAPHVTLGAKDVLMGVLRSYQHRAQNERRLAERLLGQGQAHKTIRLRVGQQAIIALGCSRDETWQVSWQALGDSMGQIAVTSQRQPSRREEQLQVLAVAPGHVQVQATKIVTSAARPAPWQSAVSKTERKTRDKRPFFLNIVIEEADGADGAH